MGAFSDGLAALAGLEVVGVTVNYAAADVPSEVDSARLPALLVMPSQRDKAQFGGRLVSGRGEGFGLLTLGETGGVYTVEITHLLLVSPEGRGTTPRSGLGMLADLTDAYFAALRATPRLGGALKYPPKVQVEIGMVSYGAGRYLAAAFRHVWTLGL